MSQSQTEKPQDQSSPWSSPAAPAPGIATAAGGPEQTVPHAAGSAVAAGNPTAQGAAPVLAHWAEPGAAPAAGATSTLTITDPQAYIRTAPPALEATNDRIPVGTRVDILEEQTVQGRKFLHVKDHDTGKLLGWTAGANAENLGQKYAASNAPHVYNVNGYDLQVFTTPDLKPPTVDVFMFFHGIGGDYASRKTNQQNGGYEDNTVISAHVPEAVTQSGRNMVAIFPQAKSKNQPEWARLDPQSYAAMVDQVLPKLSVDLGLAATPLQKGHVSLAGHSMGGSALGAAAVGLDAADVTLQDAGYGWYSSSWQQLEEWFVTGKPHKHLRIISKDDERGKGAVSNTRNITQTGFAQADVLRVAAKHNLKNPQLTPVPGDKQRQRDGGMTLDGGFDLTIDGQPQGSLRIFSIDPALPRGSDGGKHWGVKDQSMAATIRANDTDDGFGTRP